MFNVFSFKCVVLINYIRAVDLLPNSYCLFTMTPDSWMQKYIVTIFYGRKTDSPNRDGFKFNINILLNMETTKMCVCCVCISLKYI